ncbi:MAG: DNA polymerase I [Bacilli bacterium]
MEDNAKTLTLIDGNSLMFRSYYATAYTNNLMKTREGLYTNALFGFCNMLNRMLTEEIEYAFVAFDAGSKTFRHQQFSDYKGTRKPLPEELRIQIPLIKQYLDILKVKRAESFDYEADDLLASVATYNKKQFDRIRIITGDRDLLQMVDENISVFLTKKGVGELDEYNFENFYEKTKLTPSQIVEYKAIAGDNSDNLPGIKGVGEITAIKLLNQYETLDNIYEHLDELTSKMRQTFIDNKEIAYQCRYLASLKKDIVLSWPQTELKIGQYDLDELMTFFQKMEFNNFLKKLNTKRTAIKSTLAINIDGSLMPIKELLNDDGYLSVEFFGTNYFSGTFLGLGLIIGQNQFFFTKNFLANNADIKAYLENDHFHKKTFDLKMLYFVLKQIHIELKGANDDFLLASYIINPSFAFDDPKKTFDNFGPNTLAYYDNIYGANTKMKVPPLLEYAKYSIEKCLVMKSLDEDLHNQLSSIDCLPLYELEMNLSFVLSKMEQSGLLIDLNKLEMVGKQLVEKAEKIASDIYVIAQEQFNINSPKQLGEILFEKLHLPHGKKNKTGFSTNVDVLEKLAKDYEIAQKVLEYRAYTKLISTYINGLKETMDEHQFIHPLYKQALTLTGRLSSVEPNIQNMPIRSEEGQVIRSFFISRFPEGMILSADYSQIELRVLAHMANDEVMIEAFSQAFDFHTQTASTIYDVSVDKVTKDMRRVAKAINFGIIYGMSAWGLSETINISPLEANIFINKYFYTFQKTKAFLDEIIKNVKRDGFTKTIFQRRRYIPEALSDNMNLRSFGERTAMNAPIQGSAADIIKVAMINIDKRLKKEHLQSLMIAQVHDELLFDCPSNEVELMKTLVKEEMEKAVTLKVQLKAEVNVGKTWEDTK